MKRLHPRRHFLFTLAAAISLLLFLAMGVIWERSYEATDELYRSSYFVDGSSSCMRLSQFHSQSGSISFDLIDAESPLSSCPLVNVTWNWFLSRHTSTPTWRSSGVVRSWYKAGFGLAIHPRRGSGGYSAGQIQGIIPIAVPTLLAAILPTAWFIARHRRLRHQPNIPLCPQCDYNLTGNTSGVCPECGARLRSPIKQ
jgi:hypothetical protein